MSKLRKTLDDVGVYHAIVVGKLFTFKAQHGTHEHELMGTITGAMWSDEGGLKLFVSTPEFWGQPLKCLVCMQTVHGLQWHACMDLSIDELTLKLKSANLDQDAEDYEQRVQELTDEFIASQLVAGELIIVEALSTLAKSV